MTEVSPVANENWHLDKKVPIAFIFAIFLQTVGIVTYMAKLDSRVIHLEEVDQHTIRRFDEKTRLDDARYEAAQNNINRLVRMETQLGYIGDTLKDVKDKLERIAK